MLNILRGWLVLVVCCCCSGVFCQTCHSLTVMEGENITIACSLHTTIKGGNLMWQELSGDSETPLGHNIPGDNACGTGTVTCTVDSNGGITLFDVSAGVKYYRCLRGDEDGYHYFSDVNLTVLSKESMGHPVTKPLTGSKANVYKIGEKGVIHGYEQPTCDDKEDGALTVTCFPPPGLIVDKVYDHVHCNCTDSDGNSNSLNITVNRNNGHPVINNVTESMHESCAMGVNDVVYSFYLPTCKDDEDGDLIVTCFPPSGDRADVHCSCTDSDGNSVSRNITANNHIKLNNSQLTVSNNCVPEILKIVVPCVVFGILLCLPCWIYLYKVFISRNQERSTECYLPLFALCKICKERDKTGGLDERESLTLENLSKNLNDKEAECIAKSTEIEQLMEMNRKKDAEILGLKERLREMETDCTNTSQMTDTLKEENQKKDTENIELKQDLARKESECTNLSEKISELKEKNQEKDTDISDLRQKLIQKEAEYHAADKKLAVKCEELKNLKEMFLPPVEEEEVLQQADGKELDHLTSPSKHPGDEDPNSKKRRKSKYRKRAERNSSLKGREICAPVEDSPGTPRNNADGIEGSQPFNDSGFNSFVKDEKSGLDEPDATVSEEGMDEDPSYPLWKEYFIDDSEVCRGFDLDFTCKGPGLKIELKESETESENICSIVFGESTIMFKLRKHQEETIPINTGETKFGLLLGDNKKELSLYQGDAQHQNRLKTNVDMKNRKFHLLCMYKANCCQATIVGSAQLAAVSK